MPVGVDEAGRGPVLGPMVVAAALVRDEEGLRAAGVDDSKKITPVVREELERRIREGSRVAVELASAEDIDKWREHRSLNALEVELFARAVAALVEKAGPHALDEGLYLDAADVNEERFGASVKARLAELGHDAPLVVSKHKGDAIYTCVGAASIVAKVRRDREVAVIAGEAGVNVGSGYPSDPVTVAYLRNYTEEHGALPWHTRRSWETARNILRDATVRSPSLEDFR